MCKNSCVSCEPCKKKNVYEKYNPCGKKRVCVKSKKCYPGPYTHIKYLPTPELKCKKRVILQCPPKKCCPKYYPKCGC